MKFGLQCCGYFGRFAERGACVIAPHVWLGSRIRLQNNHHFTLLLHLNTSLDRHRHQHPPACAAATSSLASSPSSSRHSRYGSREASASTRTTPPPANTFPGICSADSLINIALCCLAYLPGLLHAWYIISINPEPTYQELPQDAERGNVTYYYVQTQPARRTDGTQGYGTVNSTPNSQFPGQQQGVVRPKPQAVAPPPRQQQSQAGPSEEVPPSYAQAVSGDHKVQGP